MKVDDLLTEKAVVCDGRGERGATETNNLVCTKKQKHIYGNSTHETTRSNGCEVKRGKKRDRWIDTDGWIRLEVNFSK